MANDCDFVIRASGKKKDLRKFAQWLGANYHYPYDEINNKYDEKNITVVDQLTKEELEHHVGFRIFEFWYDETKLDPKTNNMEEEDVIEANGCCAWSVESCMFDESTRGIDPKDCKMVTLPQACEMLNVKCEIFSEEPGCAFSEHFCVNNNGIIETDDCCDIVSIYLEEYDTYEDMLEDVDRHWAMSKKCFYNLKEMGQDWVVMGDHILEENKNVDSFDWEWF